jgi:hypothetical protein
MAEEWYFAQQGQQHGPVALGQLCEMATNGQLQPTDLVWRDGMPSWSQAQWVRGLFSSPQFSAEPLPLLPVAEPAEPPVVARREGPRPALDESPPLRRRPRRPARRRLGPGAWIAIVGGVLGLLVLVGGGVWVYVHFRHQGTSRSWNAAQGQRVSFHLTFKGGRKVEIWLNSNRDTDMDLFVYDPQNRVVAVDDGDGKDCYVSFVPPITQSYRVELQNRVRMEPWQQHRNGPNSGVLRFRESHERFPVAAAALPPPVIRHPPELPKPPDNAMHRAPQVIPLRPGINGITVDGKLDGNDGLDDGHRGAFCKVYTYPMRAGKQYVIDLQSAQFDSYLRLEDARGWHLAEDDDSGGNLNARIIFVPPQDGTYRIVATTFDPGAMGGYRLTVRP